MKHLKIIFASLLLIAMCAFSMTSLQSCSSKTTTNELSQVEEPQYNFYGFNTADVNSWINRAMSRKNCKLVQITSTNYEYGVLTIYADVKEYDIYGNYLRDNKAEIELHEQRNIPKQISEGRCYLKIKD